MNGLRINKSFFLVIFFTFLRLSYGMEKQTNTSLESLDANLKFYMTQFFFTIDFNKTIKNFWHFAQINKITYQELASKETFKRFIDLYREQLGSDPLLNALQNTLPKTGLIVILAKLGVEFDSIQSGERLPPLLLVSFHGSISRNKAYNEAIQLLVAAGANVNQKVPGNSKYTALHYAAKHDNASLMACLLTLKANPMVRSCFNELPITTAVNNNCFETSQLLLSHDSLNALTLKEIADLYKTATRHGNKRIKNWLTEKKKVILELRN